MEEYLTKPIKDLFDYARKPFLNTAAAGWNNIKKFPFTSIVHYMVV